MLLSDLLPYLDPLRVRGPVDRAVQRISHDSRHATSDCLFVAIRGAQIDARRFVPGLRVAAVVADGDVEADPDVTVITVNNARIALAQSAAALAGFPGRKIPVVGITGTNGKTTVAWMMAAIARAAGWIPGIIGTTGHSIGDAGMDAVHTTPEAPVLQSLLSRMNDAGCGLVAMEVSSIGLALHRADAIPFQVGVFTNLSRDHLDFHGTMAAYTDAKTRLFRELLAPGATAVVHEDLAPMLDATIPRSRQLRFGRSTEADIRAEEVQCDLSGCSATLHTPVGKERLEISLIGHHNVDNALAAVGVSLSLNLPLATAVAGLAALTSIPGRLERVPNDHGITVLVDYAHTPDALERVLTTLRTMRTGRLLTVFGCGGDRDQGKRPLMGQAASKGSDKVFVTSDNPRSESPAAIIAEILAGVDGPHTVCADRAEAIALAIGEAHSGDVVLIAGKGHERTQTTADQVVEFDDRKVAADVLRRGSR